MSISTGWQSKPPLGSAINWSNPLASGLVLCVPFNENSGTAHDLAGGLVLSPTPAAAPSWTASPDGASAKIAAASSNYFTSGSCPDTGLLGALSFLWRGSIASVGAYRDIGSKGTGANTTNSPLCVYFDQASPYSIYLSRAKATQYQAWYTSLQPVITTGPHTIAGVFPPTLDLTPTLWYDGVARLASGTFFGTVTGSPTGGGYPWRIGRRQDGGAQLDGAVSLFAVWRRQLAAAEVLSLTANPWQLFAPPAFCSFLRPPCRGFGAIALAPFTVGGKASFLTPAAGSVALAPLAAAATGSFGATAAGAIALGPFTVAAAAGFTTPAAGAIALTPLAAAATGSFGATAAGAIALGPFTVAAAAGFTTPAAGAIALGSCITASAARAYNPASTSLTNSRRSQSRPPILTRGASTPSGPPSSPADCKNDQTTEGLTTEITENTEKRI